MVYAQVPNPTGEGCRCEADEVKNTLPNQTMADIMHETSALADDVLNMVYRINGFLFPENSVCDDRPEDPRCFRDELLKTRYELHIAVRKLAEMTGQLGV